MKVQEVVKGNLPKRVEIRNGEMARGFRGRLAEGFDRGIRCPIVSPGSLKDRNRRGLEIGDSLVCVYNVAADEWESIASPSKRKASVNDAETAREFPKRVNADSNSAAVSLRRYIRVFGMDLPDNLRIVTVNDIDPFVIFVIVE